MVTFCLKIHISVIEGKKEKMKSQESREIVMRSRIEETTGNKGSRGCPRESYFARRLL